MHDGLLGSGSAFDRASAVIHETLPNIVRNPRALDSRVLDAYEHRYVAGWTYNETLAATDYEPNLM